MIFHAAMVAVNGHLSPIYRRLTGNQGDAYLSWTQERLLCFEDGVTLHVRCTLPQTTSKYWMAATTTSSNIFTRVRLWLDIPEIYCDLIKMARCERPEDAKTSASTNSQRLCLTFAQRVQIVIKGQLVFYRYIPTIDYYPFRYYMVFRAVCHGPEASPK